MTFCLPFLRSASTRVQKCSDREELAFLDKASQAERLLWRIIAACAVGWLALQVPASQAGVDVSLRLDVPSRTPVGQRVAYILILSNAGPSSATGVIVTN